MSTMIEHTTISGAEDFLIEVSSATYRSDTHGDCTVFASTIVRGENTTLRVYRVAKDTHEMLSINTIVLSGEEQWILCDADRAILPPEKRDDVDTLEVVDFRIIVRLALMDGRGIPDRPGVYHDNTGDRWIVDDHMRIIDKNGIARGWQSLPLALLTVDGFFFDRDLSEHETTV